MPERSSLTTRAQVGVEATEGVSVAASKVLNSISLGFSPMIAANMFRPTGNKFATVSAPGQEWTELSVEGAPVYDELQYLLSSFLTTGVITTPDAVNAPAARQWLFNMSSSNEDTPKSYTIEQGSSFRAHRVSGARFTELSLSFNSGRESLELGGSAIAKAIQDGIVLTAAPTELPLIPVLATQVSFYLDNTVAAIGTTKLLRVLQAEMSLSGRYGPISAYDQAQSSYAALVETEPDFTFELTPMADAQGMGLLNDLRSGVTRFLRMEAVGPIIGGAIAYRLRIDAAIKVREPGEFSDEDGVYALPFTFQMVHDPTYAKAISVALTNTQAVL